MKVTVVQGHKHELHENINLMFLGEKPSTLCSHVKLELSVSVAIITSGTVSYT